MFPPLTPAAEADIDALAEYRLGRARPQIEGRIRETIHRKRNELEQALDPEKTATARGYIQGLRTALAIPGILEEEITHGTTENTHTRG